MEDDMKPDIAYFYGLDYENKTCVDCKGAFPRWISINHAIIICQHCAERHSKLGFNISFIREMSDDWDPYLLSFIHRGGNGRFIRFSNDYHLSQMPIEEKYKTKAAEYYRRLIQSEVLADLPPEEVLMDTALQECGNTIYFPEFDNYELFKGERMQHNGNGIGITNALSQSFKTVGNGIGSVSQYISEANVKDKLIDGSTKAIEVVKDVSGTVYNYSKPVVSFLAQKAFQGAGFLFNQLSYGVSEYQNMQYQQSSLAKAKMERDQFINNKMTPSCLNKDTDKGCEDKDMKYVYPNQQQPFYCNKMHQGVNQMSELIGNSESDQALTAISTLPKPQLVKKESSELVIQSIKGYTQEYSKDSAKEKDKDKGKVKDNYKDKQSKLNPTYEVIIKGDKVNNIPPIQQKEKKDNMNQPLLDINYH